MLTSPSTTLRALLRHIGHGWRHGNLPARTVAAGTVVAGLLIGVCAWQMVRLAHQSPRLVTAIAKLQSADADRAAAAQAAEPRDVIETLPNAPSVAQVMETLQRAAEQEGAQVLSIAADDHPPTTTALGHLDIVVSIKASYPAIMIVLQQVLDRYPGATLRQMALARSVAPTSAAPFVPPGVSSPSASSPVSESEAQVTLALWRRPLGLDRAPTAPLELPASGGSMSAPASSSASTPVTTAPARGL